MNRDDAFEWFGGTADIKYAVASNAADDSFDWTFGWTGRAQFIAIHQRGDDADNGIEADNNEFNNNLLPRSNPQIYNITMCGDPDRNEGGESAARRQPAPRHGVHDPQLPDHGFKAPGSRSRRRNARPQVDNGTSQMGAGVVWNIRNCHAGAARTHCTRASPLRQQRPLPRRPARRRRRAVAGLLQPRQPELPADRRSRRWPAGSWRRSSRPTTASSKP